MRMTNENKEWVGHALTLGFDNMELFSESRWEWIADDKDGVFVKQYLKLGGVLDWNQRVSFMSEDILEETIEWAEDKIGEAFMEISKRMKLGWDE